MPVGKNELKKLVASDTCVGDFCTGPKNTKRSTLYIDYKDVDSTVDISYNTLTEVDKVDLDDNVATGMDEWIDDDLSQARHANKRCKLIEECVSFDCDSLIGTTIVVNTKCIPAPHKSERHPCRLSLGNVELSSFLDAPVDGSPLSIIDEGTDQTVVDNDVEIIPPPKNDHFVELFVDSGGDDCSFEVVIIENDLL